jgi:Uma2 family endonuclease
MSTFLDATRSNAKDLGNGKLLSAIEARKFPNGLPVDDEFPCSDGKPVDSELQELVPGLLKAILMRIWKNRPDYLFVIDMGLYYEGGCIAPDALLSLGVEQPDDGQKRSSYILSNEKVVPVFALEVVSKTYGSEYDEKLSKYKEIGILYYVIYAPLMKSDERLEVYKLIDGDYVLQKSERQSIWMPEIGLAIGRENLAHDRTNREWLYWYDETGVRYLTPWEGEENEAAKARAEAQRANAEAQRANTEAAKNKLLADRLRELGVDPDSLVKKI